MIYLDRMNNTKILAIQNKYFSTKMFLYLFLTNNFTPNISY